MKKKLLLIILMIILFSCQPIRTNNAIEVTLTAMSTRTPPINTKQVLPTKVYPTTTSIPPTQSTISTITPGKTEISYTVPITPEVIHICPTNPEVPLSGLGLDSSYRLLIIPPDIVDGDKIQTGISTISAENPIPQTMENTIQTGNWFINAYRSSPDGRWLTFDRFMETKHQYDIWMIPVNGDQAQIIKSVNLGTTIDWISDNKGVIIGVPETDDKGSSAYEITEPLFLYDFQTQTLQKLQSKPSGLIYDTFFEFKNIPYGIFYNYARTGDGHFDIFLLYDYKNNEYIQIFQWLIGSDKANVHNTRPISISYDTNGEVSFTVISEKAYGIDIASKISLKDISSNQLYDEVMQPVYMPFEFTNLDTQYLDRPDLLYIQPHKDPYLRVPSEFYLYDIPNNELKNYCFMVNYFSRKQISTDGKFIEFTNYEVKTVEDGGTSIGKAKEVIIMNLANGTYSRIPNMQAIGWGIVK